MIIVVGGTKGGTGKSTLVTNLIAVDVAQGFDSILVDCDRQASASNWAASREDKEVVRVPTVQKFGGLALTNELKALAKKYDHVFVDAGGYDSEELRAAILAADTLLIPLRPAQFDVWTLPKIIEIVAQSQLYNPTLAVSFVVNGAHTSPNVKEVDDVMALAAEVEGMIFCQTVCHNRRAFVKAAAQGKAVTELKGPERDPKAEDEVVSLYQETIQAPKLV
jgi:chromosome partitioning protein